MQETIQFHTLTESKIYLKQLSNHQFYPTKYNCKDKITNKIIKYYHQPILYKPMPFEIASLSGLSEKKIQDSSGAGSCKERAQTLVILDDNQENENPLIRKLNEKARKCVSLVEIFPKNINEQQILKLLEQITMLLQGKTQRPNQRLQNKLLQTSKSPQQAINLLKSLRKHNALKY